MDLAEEFPRAYCHEDEIEEQILAFEERHSTPVNEDDMREIVMGVQADHEDCECDCCAAA